MDTLGVALDGTETSATVLQAVAPLARAFPASITLMSAVERPDLPPERKPWLEGIAAGLREQDIQVSVELRVGAAADEILAFARERSPLLLAMATHGRRGLDRLRLGSVTEAVLRRADVPLLIARPDTAGARGKAIVVALDGSPRAETILPDVARLAKATGRAVEVASVALPAVTAGGVGEFPMYFPVDDPEPYLKELCKRIEAKPVALSGRAASSLMAYAAESGAGFLALTTHGRTGLRRALLGSIAEEILRNAPCPVLVRRSGNS
ncbi:MAG TPA: universal stress protein [Planctomycetota bacterium]